MKLQENEMQRKPLYGKFCNFCSQNCALHYQWDENGCKKSGNITELSGMQFWSESYLWFQITLGTRAIMISDQI